MRFRIYLSFKLFPHYAAIIHTLLLSPTHHFPLTHDSHIKTTTTHTTSLPTHTVIYLSQIYPLIHEQEASHARMQHICIQYAPHTPPCTTHTHYAPHTPLCTTHTTMHIYICLYCPIQCCSTICRSSHNLKS